MTDKCNKSETLALDDTLFLHCFYNTNTTEMSHWMVLEYSGTITQLSGESKRQKFPFRQYFLTRSLIFASYESDHLKVCESSFCEFYISGLGQDCGNSSVLAMELPKSCSKHRYQQTKIGCITLNLISCPHIEISSPTRSITCLLMPWPLTSPGIQNTWQSLRVFSLMTANFIHQCFSLMLRNVY